MHEHPPSTNRAQMPDRRYRPRSTSNPWRSPNVWMSSCGKSTSALRQSGIRLAHHVVEQEHRLDAQHFLNQFNLSDFPRSAMERCFASETILRSIAPVDEKFHTVGMRTHNRDGARAPSRRRGSIAFAVASEPRLSTSPHRTGDFQLTLLNPPEATKECTNTRAPPRAVGNVIVYASHASRRLRNSATRYMCRRAATGIKCIVHAVDEASDASSFRSAFSCCAKSFFRNRGE